MVREAIRAARAAGATGQILARGDAAYGSRDRVQPYLAEQAQFSLVLTKKPRSGTCDRLHP